MPINEWSDSILIAELNDEPSFSDDMETLLRKLENANGSTPDVIINAQNVSHLNSSNIGQLLELRKLLQARNARLRICAVEDSVWSVLLATRLDKVFEFTDDVSTSLASLQIGARRGES
jgi:anti-anti-sigma factor